MAFTLTVQTSISKPVSGKYAYEIIVDTENEALALCDQILQRGMSHAVNATTVKHISTHFIESVEVTGTGITGGHIFSELGL